MAGGPILVAGAINTDLVASMARAPEAGETITAGGFGMHGGGKGANQAVAAARAGATVRLVGAVGDDAFGRARRVDLERDGIGIEWVRTVPDASSGVALIFVEAEGTNRIAYVPGATLTVPPEVAVAALEAIRPGLVLAPNELPTAALRALFEEAGRIGARVVFNAAPEPELARDLLGLVSVLVVNEVEAGILLGERGVDHRAAVARLRELGPGTAILTAGKDGAWLGDGDGIELVPAPAVAVVDTTGAGDTFCGAFSAELARGVSTREAARFGVVASAISVTRAGAQTSIPTRAEVLAFQQ